MEEIKKALDSMGIPYKEGEPPANQLGLIQSFKYEALPLVVDLTKVKNIDAETGTVVRYENQQVDNGVYIFTVLHSGQGGFIVVIPSRVSRGPFVRKATADITNAINGIDLPPLMPFDMVEATAHVLANTFMKMVMEACRVPEEYAQAFLHMYMPKFLANVGMYFVGATKEDGSPMIYEEVVNIEPMMIWNSIQKGAAGNEGESAGRDGREGDTKAGETEEGTAEAKEGEEEKETPLP